MRELVKLSIIIVNWNTRDLLDQCLAAVYQNAPSVNMEIIVVDNASGDGSVEMVRERYPQVRLIINEENLGFAAANNQGIRLSCGEYILLLNSDVLVLPLSLERLISFAEAKKDAGVVGAQLRNPDLSFQASYNDDLSLVSETLLALGLARKIYGPAFPSYPEEKSRRSLQCDWVGGASLLARRTAVEQVGLLDETYFMYVEEADWCLRMRKAGWKVYYDAASDVIHLGGQSADRASAQQQILLYRSKARYFRKHHGLWAGRIFKAVVFVSAAVKSLYWKARSALQNRDQRLEERSQSHWQVVRSL